MIVFRFANKQYADDLTGTGAKLFGGRWNHKGLAALYTSSSISLALLEVLVNALTLQQLNSLSLLQLKIPASLEASIRALNKLKQDWETDIEYCRYIGSEFLQNNNFVMMKCPSAVVSQEWNYLINPLHAEFAKIEIVDIINYKFDKRLFKLNA